MLIKGIEKYRCRLLLVCIICVIVVKELMIFDLFRIFSDYVFGRFIFVQILFVDVELKVLYIVIKILGFYITIIQFIFLFQVVIFYRLVVVFFFIIDSKYFVKVQNINVSTIYLIGIKSRLYFLMKMSFVQLSLVSDFGDWFCMVVNK